MEALIWPEEYAHRAPLLESAISLARRDPPPLLRGDALDLLSKVLKNIPSGAVACVFHTFTVNQFSEEARERFDDLLREHAKERALYRISVEWIDGDAPLLRLTAYDREGEQETLLARCDDHGEWLEWTGPAG